MNLSVCKSDLLTMLRKTYLYTAGLSASEAPAEGFAEAIPDKSIWAIIPSKAKAI